MVVYHHTLIQNISYHPLFTTYNDMIVRTKPDITPIMTESDNIPICIPAAIDKPSNARPKHKYFPLGVLSAKPLQSQKPHHPGNRNISVPIQNEFNLIPYHIPNPKVKNGITNPTTYQKSLSGVLSFSCNCTSIFLVDCCSVCDKRS